MTGNERFELNGKPLDFDLLDFWRYQYSNIYNMQETIAEYLVAKSLGIEKAHNTDYWTLFDILYRDTRIEVKQTSYYHPWNEGGKVSRTRTFSIAKANSNYENAQEENRFERQNDIYVFCLNTGETKETSYPLDLNNWKFYIIPTPFINEHCGNNKTISLNRIRSFGFPALRFDEIKNEVDHIISIKNNSENG